MTKNPLKFLWHLFWFIIYKNECIKEDIAYMAAKEKGMYCEGIRNGMAKFDPNRPPQAKPEHVSFKEAMKNLNKKENKNA